MLWRVLLGVLAIFGIGIVLYIAGWLLIPADGDTASPIESLFGRGYSSTSSVLTLVMAVLAVVMIGGLTDSWAAAVLAAVALVIVALAVSRGTRRQPYQAAPPLPPLPPMAPPPQPGDPTATTATYQQPFAPHGPYPGGPPPVAPPPPVRPRRESSPLGRLILGVVLFSLGALGLADMAGVPVPAEAYVAAALAVVGAGLVVGAWLGRARGFIALGLILALILPMVASGPRFESEMQGENVVWTPTGSAEVLTNYSHKFGSATLDLTQVDFAGTSKEINADISWGDLTVLLPSDVDANVISDVNFGEAQIFGQDTDGVGNEQTTQDLGSDGAGGGNLVINLDVSFASAEVTR